MPYNYCSKKNGAFWSVFSKKDKNGFPIVFSKCDLAGGGGGVYQFFCSLKKPNIPKYAQDLVVTAHLSPPPLNTSHNMTRALLLFVFLLLYDTKSSGTTLWTLPLIDQTGMKAGAVKINWKV